MAAMAALPITDFGLEVQGMKKIFAIMFVLVLTLSMIAACGDGDSNITATPAVGSSNNITPSNAPESPPSDKSGTSLENQTDFTEPSNTGSMTKEEFLALFGLTEDDIRPGGFVNYEIWGCTTKEGTVYIQIDEASGTSAIVQEWFERMFEKIKQVSDDGKLHEFIGLDSEYVLPTAYGASVYTMFAYIYKDDWIVICLNFDPFGFGLSSNEIKKISAYEIILMTY